MTKSKWPSQASIRKEFPRLRWHPQSVLSQCKGVIKHPAWLLGSHKLRTHLVAFRVLLIATNNENTRSPDEISDLWAAFDWVLEQHEEANNE